MISRMQLINITARNEKALTARGTARKFFTWAQANFTRACPGVATPLGSGKSLCSQGLRFSTATDRVKKIHSLKQSMADYITSNLGETHLATCPLYRKHGLPPLKWPKTRWKNVYL